MSEEAWNFFTTAFMAGVIISPITSFALHYVFSALQRRAERRYQQAFDTYYSNYDYKPEQWRK